LKIGELGEFGWIRRLERLVRTRDPDVVDGIGDDAAVLDTGGERALVATCDSQVESVHFRPEWIEPMLLGRRVAAINLSDIAAMGAEPRWALASLAAPAETEVERLDAIYEGMVVELERAGAVLVGGNTTRSADGMVIDLFLLGQVDRRRVLLRSGARPGDLICVTGDLGASRAGLIALQRDDLELSAGDRDRVIARHLEPSARIEEGRALAGSGLAHACIDVSDGLLADAGHLARRSEVSIRLDADRIPVSPATAAVARAAGVDPIELALGGGEDFELLFAVAGDRPDDAWQNALSACSTPISVIGRAMAGPSGVSVQRDGERLDPILSGFDHFRE
jgi:thiamine-monophosphate kinase